MGQAVVDAPDPLQNPKPATPPSADDMLSQLAGDEIDRLLAEAEGQRPVKEVAPSPAPIAAAPMVEGESVGFDSKQSAAEIDALLAQAESTEPTPAAPPAEPPAAAVPAASVTAPVAPAAVVEAPKPQPVPAGVEIAKEIEQSEAERKALRAPEVKADVSPELIIDRTARLPLILKPLELLSSPLDACPDIVREAIGKMAIVTMVNAIAVLSYVLIFRRHHH